MCVCVRFVLACDNTVALGVLGGKAQMAWRARHIFIRGHLLHQAALGADVHSRQRATDMTKGVTPGLHAQAMASWVGVGGGIP